MGWDRIGWDGWGVMRAFLHEVSLPTMRMGDDDGCTSSSRLTITHSLSPIGGSSPS